MESVQWDEIKRVRDEVERILGAPYDVSLENLRDVLSRVSQESLQLWAEGNICQINGLAALIVDSIEKSPPFQLELLQTLSNIRTFCDAVLKRQPNLLHAFLAKATSLESMFDIYATTCITLLSTDSSLVEPAILPRFLSTLLNKAVLEPTASNIRSIYGVVSGPKFDLLRMMTPDLLMELQEQLLKILLALEAADHSANLLCLAILAKLASAESQNLATPERPLWSETNISPQACPSNRPVSAAVATCSAAKHFFTAKRGSKTLDLVVLKVILACSRSCSLPSSEIIESLKISEEIVDAVGKEEKRMWMLKNGTKSRKLHEKVLRPDIHIGVRCAAINFISSLTEGQPIVSDVIEIIPNLLRVSTPVLLTRRTVENYLIQCDESAIPVMLLEVLDLAGSESSFDGPHLNRLKKASYLVSILITKIQNSTRLRKAIRQSLSTDAFAEPIQKFLRLPSPVVPAGFSHNSSMNCPFQNVQAKCDLSKSLCVLFMKSAMYTSEDEMNLDPSVAASLLDKHIEFWGNTIATCDSHLSRSVSSGTGHVPLFAFRALPLEELSSRNWRDILLKSLVAAAQDQHQSIVRMVGEICQDLETRCNNTEQPLRKATERSDELELKLHSSEIRVAELENETKERLLVLTALKSENHRLVEQADTVDRELQVLSTTNEQLSNRLERVEREALEFAQMAREKEEHVKIAHLAIVMGKDEVYDKQALTLAEAEARVTSLEHELAQKCAVSEENIRRLEHEFAQKCAIGEENIHRLEQELAQERSISEEKIGRLEDSMNTMNKEFEATRLLAASREEEILNLLDCEAKGVVEKHELESKWKESELQREVITLEINAKTVTYESEKASLLLKHQAALAATNAERESYEATIQRLGEELNKVEQDANRAARSSEISLAEAQRKIKDLECERKTKAKEFAEVKDLSSRLMAVMGMDPSRTATNPVHRKSRSSKSISSQMGQDLQGLDSAANPRDHFISSAASVVGPTTKRTKMQGRSKSSVAQTLTSFTPSFGLSDGGRANPGNRVPLKEINVSPQKKESVALFQPLLRTCDNLQDIDNEGLDKENEDINTEEDEQEYSFNESDIFTSTDHQRYSRNNERSMSGFGDDTTVEY